MIKTIFGILFSNSRYKRTSPGGGRAIRFKSSPPRYIGGGSGLSAAIPHAEQTVDGSKIFGKP
ncbi:MAG: hypothetical protein RIF40_15685 [Imperialibacter sp.]|uniref:hypothetical protein n=1 Tax=Imperialibacter sp. TaxID=2038411 RepID=UPI0032F02BA1